MTRCVFWCPVSAVHFPEQFSPDLPAPKLLAFVCDYARSDDVADHLNQCLHLDVDVREVTCACVRVCVCVANSSRSRRSSFLKLRPRRRRARGIMCGEFARRRVVRFTVVVRSFVLKV